MGNQTGKRTSSDDLYPLPRYKRSDYRCSICDRLANWAYFFETSCECPSVRFRCTTHHQNLIINMVKADPNTQTHQSQVRGRVEEEAVPA